MIKLGEGLVWPSGDPAEVLCVAAEVRVTEELGGV